MIIYSEFFQPSSTYPLTQVIDRLVLAYYDSSRYGAAEPFLKLQLNNYKTLYGISDPRAISITGLLINSLLNTSKYRYVVYTVCNINILECSLSLSWTIFCKTRHFFVYAYKLRNFLCYFIKFLFSSLTFYSLLLS